MIRGLLIAATISASAAFGQGAGNTESQKSCADKAREQEDKCLLASDDQGDIQCANDLVAALKKCIADEKNICVKTAHEKHSVAVDKARKDFRDTKVPISLALRNAAAQKNPALMFPAFRAIRDAAIKSANDSRDSALKACKK